MRHIFTAIIILAALTCSTGIAGATDWHVYPGNPYPQIQNAINGASAGDTIYVHAGTYLENVVVDKRLTLNGIGLPVVDASGSGTPITITAAANGCVIEAFNMTGSGPTWDDAGIKIMSNDNMIRSNFASNNTVGIWLHGSGVYRITNNNIIGNIAWDNKKGIYVQFSSDNIIESNIVKSSDEDGIMLYYADDNTLPDNTADSNGGGIAVSYSQGNEVRDCAITNSVWCDFYLSEAADLVSINTTFNGSKVDCDGTSKLTVRNYLHIQTVNESSDPIQGADVQVKDNGEVIHASTGFGGSDPQTGADGYVRDILVTDRMYPGSSAATENTTTAEVKCGSFTFIDNPRDVDMSVSHTEIFTPKPDLVITHKWVNISDCTIHYTVTNIGTGTALSGHNSTLYVDGVEVARDPVEVNLEPGKSSTESFTSYVWSYSPPEDVIKVCADDDDVVKESDETNNCIVNYWRCGDVDENRIINIIDARLLMNHICDPTRYPINEWAGNVDGDSDIDGDDVQLLVAHVFDPAGHQLNCSTPVCS